MVSTNNVKKRQPQAAHSFTVNNGGNYEEFRNNDLETVNSTFRYFTRNDDPQKVRLERISHSLKKYLSAFEAFSLTKEFTKKLMKGTNIYIDLLTKLNLKKAVSNLEIYEILRITSKYMLFNEIEFVFFLQAAVNLKSADINLELFSKLAEVCNEDYIFQKENIKGNSNDFLAILVISLFVGLNTKNTLNPESAQMFCDAFENLLSPKAFFDYSIFAENNQKLMQYNLIEMNDVFKRLENGKVEEIETDFIDPRELYGELPQKKAQVMMNETDDPLDLYMNPVDNP